MRKNTEKKPRGRPPVSRMDNRAVQRRILKCIIVSGTETNCWDGIISRTAYKDWVRAHKAYWEKRVGRAIKQHYNHKTLADPSLKSLTIQVLVNKINNEDLTVSELIKVLQFLPDIEL